jgi:hypothetical protein
MISYGYDFNRWQAVCGSTAYPPNGIRAVAARLGKEGRSRALRCILPGAGGFVPPAPTTTGPCPLEPASGVRARHHAEGISFPCDPDEGRSCPLDTRPPVRRLEPSHGATAPPETPSHEPGPVPETFSQPYADWMPPPPCRDGLASRSIAYLPGAIPARAIPLQPSALSCRCLQ